MRQYVAEKLPLIRPPSLTVPTLHYLDGRFAETLDLYTKPWRKALLDPVGEQLVSGLDNIGKSLGSLAASNAALMEKNKEVEWGIAIYVVDDILETAAGNVEPEYDYTKLDPKEIQHRSILGEILRKGPHYAWWVKSYGEDSLDDPNRLYSPRLAAGLASITIKGRFSSDRHSHYSNLRWSLQPHPNSLRSRKTEL